MTRVYPLLNDVYSPEAPTSPGDSSSVLGSAAGLYNKYYLKENNGDGGERIAAMPGQE